MPPPPPPPGPPKPPPGPTASLSLGSSSSGPPDRSALLKSIQKGKALKKTVTNDRSAPVVGGKVNNNQDVNANNRPSSATSTASSNGSSATASNMSAASAPRLPGIGGLFGEPFPKLRPTGSSVNSGTKDGPRSWTSGSSTSAHQQSTKNHFNSTGPRSGNFGGGLQNSVSTSSITNSYSSSSLPLKDELVVARNRFLAESMFNGTNSVRQPKKYSVPTCHTTLKQLEQARLAREFEQQRKTLLNNNNNVEASDLDDLPKIKRSLSRTSSVGKLVSNFENHGNFINNLEQVVTRNKPPLAAKPSLRHTNSTPSLTPSASPSSSTSSVRKSGPPPPPPSSTPPCKPSTAPPPPPPQNAKPKHPSSKPPPPPPGGPPSGGSGRAPMRTRSFNQGRGDEATPAPPVRTASQQQQQQQQNYSSQTMPNRRGPQARPSLAGSNLQSKPAPMKPPSAPPPPPPTAHPPPPPHRTQPAPPPPPSAMQSPYAKSIASSANSNPPTPPTRRHSLRTNGGNNGSPGGETFESRFSHLFKSPQYLPPPEPYTQCAKTYPSRSQQQLGGRQGSMMKRAPAPPPPPVSKGAQPPPPPPAPPAMWTSQPIRG